MSLGPTIDHSSRAHDFQGRPTGLMFQSSLGTSIGLVAPSIPLIVPIEQGSVLQAKLCLEAHGT